MRDIIVIGASAGGLEVLGPLAAALRPGFPATLFIVCHYPNDAISELPTILSRRSQLLARHPYDGEEFHPGHIYIAPPDHHLLIEERCIRLSHGGREHHVRPAIDPLFRSAARTYGSRVVGVILSGGGADGISGLMAIRAYGGAAVVQDPDDSVVPILPQKAIAMAGADHIVRSDQLAPLLVNLATHDEFGETSSPNVEKAGLHEALPLTCPECGGVLRHLGAAVPDTFRCYLGHQYTAPRYFGEQLQQLEAALWSAVRLFRERGAASNEIADHNREIGESRRAERFRDEAQVSKVYGDAIENLLLDISEKMRSNGPEPQDSE